MGGTNSMVSLCQSQLGNGRIIRNLGFQRRKGNSNFTLQGLDGRKNFMMKRIKWGISKLIAGLALLKLASVFFGRTQQRGSFDNASPCPLIFRFPIWTGQSQCGYADDFPKDTNMHKFLVNFVRCVPGKDTVINIVHPEIPHLQAGYLTGKAMTANHIRQCWSRLAYALSSCAYQCARWLFYHLKSQELDFGKCIQAHPKTEMVLAV